MIEIKIDGKVVDLQPEASLSLEMVSPYFSFDAIEPSRVLPFTLPFTPANRKLLGWFERPESTVARSQTYYAEKYSDSHCLEKGIVEILDVTEAGYNVVFIKNLSDFFGLFGNETLNKLPLGQEPIPAVLTANQDPQTSTYCWPTIQNPQFYGTNTATVTVNEYGNGAYTATGPKVPMFFLRWLMLRIATLCNFTIIGDFMTDPNLSRLVLYNTHSLDGLTSIVYANHLPELRVMEFFMELRRAFCLTFDFEIGSRTLRIGFMDSVLAGTAGESWDAKGQWTTNKRPLRETRFELASTQDSSDATTKKTGLLADKYTSPFDAGNPREQLFRIETKFSTLEMDAATNFPRTEQVGISNQFGQQTNKFSARLLFYDTANRATATLGGHSLYVTGPGGLHDKHWRAYEAWRKQTFESKQKVWLSSGDLVKFRFSKKIYLNGQNYLLSSLSTGLPIKNLSNVSLLKC